MGGMDWYCNFDEKDFPLVEAMLNAGRLRARRLSVRWSSSIKSNVCAVIVNGEWWRIDLLIARLSRDLPTICEAIPLEHRSPSRRRGVGRSFAHIASQYRLGAFDLHETGWTPKLVSRRGEPWDVMIYTFSAPNAPDLERRLEVTARMLMDWEFGEIAPEVMLEELHTAAELSLKRALWGKYRGRGSFKELVERAEQSDMLKLPGIRAFRQSLRTVDVEESITVKELLLSLKDARKVARHEARETALPWLEKWVVGIGEVLEVLAQNAWTASQSESSERKY